MSATPSAVPPPAGYATAHPLDSALDTLDKMSRVAGIVGGIIGVAAARAELADLRMRAEEYELVLRALMTGKPEISRAGPGTENDDSPPGIWMCWYAPLRQIHLADDGAGMLKLPLTPEARAALKGSL